MKCILKLRWVFVLRIELLVADWPEPRISALLLVEDLDWRASFSPFKTHFSMFQLCFHGSRKIKTILLLKIMDVTVTYPLLAKIIHLSVIVNPPVAPKMKSIGFVPNTRHVITVLQSKRPHHAKDLKYSWKHTKIGTPTCTISCATKVIVMQYY